MIHLIRKMGILKLITQHLNDLYMGQVTKLRLSCYQVLLSVDSKTRYKTATIPWADPHLSETMFGTKQPVNNSHFNLIFYKKSLYSPRLSSQTASRQMACLSPWPPINMASFSLTRHMVWPQRLEGPAPGPWNKEGKSNNTYTTAYDFFRNLHKNAVTPLLMYWSYRIYKVT